MDLIEDKFIKNKKPFTSFYSPKSPEERQRALYYHFIKDGSKMAKSAIKDYVNFIIDAETKKYLYKIGNDIGIDIGSNAYIYELLAVFLHDIGKHFNIPDDEEDWHYEKFRTFVEKHVKEL